MRTNSIATVSLTIVLACAVGLVHPCYPPPIWIDVVWEKGGALSGTVEVVATVPASVEVERIDFFVDGKLIGTDATEAHIIKWDTTTLPDGKHELHARGATPDGDVLKSNVLAVVVDNGQDKDSEADG